MTRAKPRPVVIADLNQAEGAMAELAEIARNLVGIEAEMNQAIDQAKTRASNLADPLKARKKALEHALGTFGQLNKAELFRRRKSLEMAFGIIGFRKATKLLTQPKVTLAMVLEKLREYGFAEAIRTKQSVDREAMREWPDERLETVGMRRVSSDEFFIEIKTEDL